MPASALLLAARVASLNLCADEYLLLLARPEEIASVSFLSHDRLESPLWKQARRYPSNGGSLETVLRTKPNVVMTMGGGGRSTSMIARRLSIRSVDLKLPSTVEDVASNLNAVASALGEPSRARPLLGRLRALRASTPRRQVDAIWLSTGGESLSVPSAGAEWMQLAGLRQRPLAGGRVTIETLLVHPPSIVVQSNYRRGQVSAGNIWLSHPLVRNAHSKRLVTDGRAWTCRGPLIMSEIERLKAAQR